MAFSGEPQAGCVTNVPAAGWLAGALVCEEPDPRECRRTPALDLRSSAPLGIGAGKSTEPPGGERQGEENR